MLARYYSRPEYELYDLQNDPNELSNLAGREELSSVQHELTSELNHWIKDQGDELTVFHPPLMLDAPETWVPRKKKRN
ncbi:heparan N-sulfatase [Rhodopirellula maiorica SM1]|uniref:Heparan N-sulfatase n=1 Tax=Rhodopirellula maiorica SM1 TaxID=1265738 RepID=M5RXG8_9BACT|nr:heparan N-sulfatase [Rhodopirellula maiorica SM1]